MLRPQIAMAIVQMGRGQEDALAAFEPDPDVYFGDTSGSDILSPLSQQRAALWSPRRACPRDDLERARLERTVRAALGRAWAMADGFYVDLDTPVRASDQSSRPPPASPGSLSPRSGPPYGIGPGVRVCACALPSPQTAGGHTLLHLAACLGMPDLARFLLELGSDYRAVDRSGLTALQLAAWHGQRDVVAALVEGTPPTRPGPRLPPPPFDVAHTQAADGLGKTPLLQRAPRPIRIARTATPSPIWLATARSVDTELRP